MRMPMEAAFKFEHNLLPQRRHVLHHVLGLLKTFTVGHGCAYSELCLTVLAKLPLQVTLCPLALG